MVSPFMNAPSGLLPRSMSSSRSSIRCMCCWNCARSRRCIRSPEPLIPEFAARRQVLGAGSAGDIDEFIADDGIGSCLGGGIVGDAGQPVALDGHGDFDHAIGLIGIGKFHRADFADADAVHAHRRARRHAGGIRQVEVDLGFGLEEGAPGEQVRQRPQNQQCRQNHGGRAKFRPIHLLRGRHSLRIVPRPSRVTQDTMKASR